MATNSTGKTFIEGLTFDDVLLVPAYSEILPRDVEIKTRLTKDITLNVPLLSAAMDTVTEASLAIALAREGGIEHRQHPRRVPGSQRSDLMISVGDARSHRYTRGSRIMGSTIDLQFLQHWAP